MSRADDDTRLVAVALAGQDGARRRLAERLLAVIHREVAINVLRWGAGRDGGARQCVADIVQDVLVSLFEHDARELRRWDPQRGRSLDSFVRLVARRRAARTLGRSAYKGAPAPDEAEPVDEASLVERLERRAELGEVLRDLYAQMSPRDMELFELLFVQELDPSEVGRRLEMSRGAVNAWSYRTRKQARALAVRRGTEQPSERDDA